MCSPACPPSTLQGNSATLPRCIFQMLSRQQHELDTGKKAFYCIYFNIYNTMNRYLNRMNSKPSVPFRGAFFTQIHLSNVHAQQKYYNYIEYKTKPIYLCMYYIYICIFQGLKRLPSLFHHIPRVPSLHVISHRHHRQPTQRLFFHSKLSCFAPFFVALLFSVSPRFILLHFEPPHPPKRSFVRPNRKPFLSLIDWPKHVGHFC